MCGIAGLAIKPGKYTNICGVLTRMGEAIRHRGPDGCGQYQDESIGLCHQRLSIIDLSDAGHQPMKSSTGRYVVTFNGEIYNFPELRKKLESQGTVFNGHSDTEVLIALFEQQGPDCLSQLNGMFAFAVWDTIDKTLFLARDRLGKKPLYYYTKGEEFIFASEIKAILSVPGVDRSIRADAVQDYFTYHYVPDPKSIFQHVHKLSPGHWMLLKNREIKIQQYWDISFSNNSAANISTVGDELFSIINTSVKDRMISDVPLGAFLSGGVDSSAVVAMMSNAQTEPVTTCSIGFKSEAHNELKYARTLAEKYSTTHHEFIVEENVEDSLLKIAGFFDEPFADSSFIPTYFVSNLAKQKVTVAMAGDGGDENFAGYTKYILDKRENKIRSLVPSLVRRSLLPALHKHLVKPNHATTRRLSSLTESLSMDPDRGFFRSNAFFNSHLWNLLVTEQFKTSLGGYDSADLTLDKYHGNDAPDHLSKILYTDLKSYLPGDILVKVDRMSMANSLEVRAPLLDYRVVEFAASLPSNLKLREGESKYALKRCFHELLSDEILYRKKMGFTVPMEQWLKQGIRKTVERYLFKPDNGLSNYFSMEVIRNLWNIHQSGKMNHTQELWSLFMFEVWWQNYMAH